MALVSHHGEIFRFGAAFAASPSRSARSRCSRRSAWRTPPSAPASELAYGDVKRVELAIALANDPRLLLMDEPTAGMAPRERNELIALVKRLVVEREHLGAVHRTFDGRGVRLCRPHHRSGARRLIADGNADDDPRQRESAAGLFRHRQHLQAPCARRGHERADARGGGAQGVVWRRANSVRACRSKSAAARWSR